jgi:hypothetical protein
MKISTDVNGNKVLKVTVKDWFITTRGYSIQTNGNLPRTHREGLGPWTVIELKLYVKKFGTTTQKRNTITLITYKEFTECPRLKLDVETLEEYYLQFVSNDTKAYIKETLDFKAFIDGSLVLPEEIPEKTPIDGGLMLSAGVPQDDTIIVKHYQHMAYATYAVKLNKDFKESKSKVLKEAVNYVKFNYSTPFVKMVYLPNQDAVLVIYDQKGGEFSIYSCYHNEFMAPIELDLSNDNGKFPQLIKEVKTILNDYLFI